MNDHGGGGGGDFGGGGFNFGGGHHDGGGHHPVGGHHRHQDSTWNSPDPAGFDGSVRGSERYRPLSARARVLRWIVRLAVIAVIAYVAWYLFSGG